MFFTSGTIFGIFVVTIIIFLIVAKFKKRYRYFSDRGIPYFVSKSPRITKMFSTEFFNELLEKMYNTFRDSDSPCVGFFMWLTPTFLVRDPGLVESIMIKDFSHFQNHGMDIDIETNPLAGHLFNMKGDQWRTLRHKLVPTFTSGKLRGMVPLMEEQADNLIREIKLDSKLQQDTNLKELFKMYTISVIASCAFGIDPQSIKDPNCEFKKVLEYIVNPSLMTRLRIFVVFLIPKYLAKFIKFKAFFKDAEGFMLSFTKQAFEMRKKSGVKRNDFIQLLLELKEKGSVDLDSKDMEGGEKDYIETFQPSESLTSKLEFTDELLMAQVFVFLIGGFEGTAFVTATTMYTLSKHPEIQERVRTEVNQVISRHNGINYQSLRDMKLLQACMDETLRLYNNAPGYLFRECNKSYTLNNGIVIEKGTQIIIPTKLLHLDSKHWTNPDRFEPERFLNNDNVRPGTYLPFGLGPRICIAQRLAFIITKLIIAKLILNFDLQPSPKTKEPLKITSFIGADNEGGLWGSFRDLSSTG